MRVERHQTPHSSFLSMEKDMSIIMNEMLKDERLKRLLYYNTSDALEKPNLTEDQSLQLIGSNIRYIPKFNVENGVKSYIVIRFDNFVEGNNPEFRDNRIEFDIICHYDQWQLKDFGLRPYKIAGEIDSIFNTRKLTGIGEIQFYGATQVELDNEFGAVCLIYQTWHGGEDKYRQPNPQNEEQFQKDFESYIKSK